MMDISFNLNNQKTVVRKIITTPDFYLYPERPQILQTNFPSSKWDNIEFKMVSQIPLVLGMFPEEKIGIIAFQPEKGRPADLAHCFVVTDDIGFSFLTKIWDYFWKLGSNP